MFKNKKYINKQTIQEKNQAKISSNITQNHQFIFLSTYHIIQHLLISNILKNINHNIKINIFEVKYKIILKQKTIQTNSSITICFESCILYFFS